MLYRSRVQGWSWGPGGQSHLGTAATQHGTARQLFSTLLPQDMKYTLVKNHVGTVGTPYMHTVTASESECIG